MPGGQNQRTTKTLIPSSFLENALIFKNYELEGFLVNPENTDSLNPKTVKYFTDSRYKIILDNTAPYGHFLSDWMYGLIEALETIPAAPKDILVLLHRGPEDVNLQINHISTLTKFLVNKLKDRGYGVDYIETDYFYVTNFIVAFDSFLKSYARPFAYVPKVRRFITEDITTSSYGRKIYLSRSKTTTSAGNRNSEFNNYLILNQELNLPIKESLDLVRTNHQYKFCTRIDDEQLLENYLKSLGFEILIPEDFNSYQDQLDYISEAKILASITSSGLYGAYALNPKAAVVEFVTPFGETDYEGNLIPSTTSLEDCYRAIALTQGNRYVSISNFNCRAKDIISQIESDANLKALLSS